MKKKYIFHIVFMHPGISILFVDCWKRCRQINRAGIPTIPVDSPTEMFGASLEIWKQGPVGICWLVFYKIPNQPLCLNFSVSRQHISTVANPL